MASQEPVLATTINTVTRAVMLYMDRPRAAGKFDCVVSPCMAFGAIWSTDAVRHLPKYHSKADAMKRIKEAGGALELCDTFADRAGLVRREKHLGALGQFARGVLPVCFAVCVGEYWATMKENGGVLIFSDEPQRVWGV